jgi:hypothetical protein
VTVSFAFPEQQPDREQRRKKPWSKACCTYDIYHINGEMVTKKCPILIRKNKSWQYSNVPGCALPSNDNFSEDIPNMRQNPHCVFS